MVDLATLSFRVDTSGLKGGADALDVVTNSANKMVDSVSKIGPASQGGKGGVDAITVSVDNASAAIGKMPGIVDTTTTAINKIPPAVNNGKSAIDGYVNSVNKAIDIQRQLDAAVADLNVSFVANGNLAKQNAANVQSGALQFANLDAVMKRQVADINVLAVATRNGTVATREGADAHGVYSTQAMAAFHATRSMAEGIAMGIPPTQMLAMQMNHLSYAASGPGGLTGAFKDAFGMLTGILTPMRLLGGAAAAGAVGMYLLYESVKTTELKFADLQDRIGGTLQSLHGLQSNATLSSGIGSDDFLKNMEKFGELAVEAQHGIGNLAQLFRANGVAISQDVNVNLARTADLVANAANQQEKYRIIQEAGLPPTFQWVQYLSQGGDAILKAANQANGFGDAAERAMIEKARKFDTEWAKAWQNFKDEARATVIDAAGLFDYLIEKARQGIIAIGPNGTARAIGVNILANSMNGVAGMSGSTLTQQQANEFYRATGVGGASVTIGGGKPTVNPQDVMRALQLEQQRISIMGQLASVEEQVRVKEIAIQMARLNGVPITKAQSDAILQYTRNEAIGITALQAQTDAYKIQAQTIGMTTGQAAAYTAVQSKILENQRLGHPLSEQQIADLRNAADAMGAARDMMDRLQETTQLTGNVFNDFGQALLQGKSGADALKSALTGLESSLVRIASNKLAESLLGGLMSPGAGGFFGGLFGGGGGVLPGGLPLGQGGIGHAASGGSFGSGDWSVVGENGPELVRFGSDATVIPNNKIGGGSGDISVKVYNAPAGDTATATATRGPNGQVGIEITLRRKQDANNADLLASGESMTNRAIETRYGLKPVL